MQVGERSTLSPYKNLSGPGVCRLYLTNASSLHRTHYHILQLPIMLFSLCAFSVFTASALACAEHGNHHYAGAQIKKRAEAGPRDWEYATSYDWGSIQAGIVDPNQCQQHSKLTFIRL